MTMHYLYRPLVKERVSFNVSASDLELISHGRREFLTLESSHDHELSAQARPVVRGPAILFRVGYTSDAHKI